LKLTEISQYDALPGQLVEWRLHPETIDAAARSPQDPRPPSYTQDAHVKLATFLRDIGVQAPTWLATAFDFQGALDADVMEETLLQWITRHETLRSGLRPAGEELERFTLSIDEVSLERSVIGDFSAGTDIVRYLEDRFDEAANPLTWPPYMFVTVAREDGFTVYLAFDHSNVDGYSMAQIAYEIHELYDAGVAGRSAELAEAGSYVDYSRLERDASDHVDADDASVVRWRDFVETCGGGLPAFPLDLGIEQGCIPKQTGGCEWLLDAAQAAEFDAACKEAGGNFGAGVLAAASLTAYELGGQSTYRTVMPFHTRTESRWATSLGWYIGLAPLEIVTAYAEDFRDLVRMARSATTLAKPVARVPFVKAFGLLETPVRPVSVMSYIDARAVPGAANWTEWNAHAFGKVSYGDEVYFWINRTREGVYLTCRYPHTELAHRNVNAYIEHTRNVLASVARNGTYDFAGHLAAGRVAAA
jgi:hypothetical protein